MARLSLCLAETHYPKILCSLLTLTAWARYKEVRGHCHIFQMRPRSRPQALWHPRDWTWVTQVWRQHLEVTVKYVLKDGYWPHNSRGNGCSKSCHDSMGLLKNCQTPHGQKLRLRKMKVPRSGFIIQANSLTNGRWDDMWRHSLFTRTFKEFP